MLRSKPGYQKLENQEWLDLTDKYVENPLNCIVVSWSLIYKSLVEKIQNSGILYRCVIGFKEVMHFWGMLNVMGIV